jgi:hypothetical protein
MASKEDPPSLAYIGWWYSLRPCLWCRCLCPYTTDQRPGRFPRSLRVPFPDSSSLASCSSTLLVDGVCARLYAPREAQVNSSFHTDFNPLES